MRLLMGAVVGMGVLIVAGVIGLGFVVSSRLSGGGNAMASLMLDEPAGTRIVGTAAAPDRVAVTLSGGGGPDRVVLVDTRNGKVVGRLGLAR